MGNRNEDAYYDDTVRDGDGAQRLGSKAGQGTFRLIT
jgi:hypothetical protein